MTGSKHERDGESFIVSEGVNLDELDLENMVHVDVPEILKTQYAQPPSIESIPGMVPQVSHIQERIWLEITLNVDGDLIQFPGYIEYQHITPNVKTWRLRMDRSSAAHLMMVVADSTIHSNKTASCTQLKWVYVDEERVVDLAPPSVLLALEVEDNSDSDMFVKVKFEITNL